MGGGGERGGLQPPPSAAPTPPPHSAFGLGEDLSVAQTAPAVSSTTSHGAPGPRHGGAGDLFLHQSLAATDVGAAGGSSGHESRANTIGTAATATTRAPRRTELLIAIPPAPPARYFTAKNRFRVRHDSSHLASVSLTRVLPAGANDVQREGN